MNEGWLPAELTTGLEGWNLQLHLPTFRELRGAGGGNQLPMANGPVLWPPHAKSWLTGKDSDAGRDWGQEEKGTPEDEMAGWHHWLDGRESWVKSGSWWWTGRPGMLQFMGSQSWTRLSDWTELNWMETQDSPTTTIVTFREKGDKEEWSGIK